MYGFCGPKEVSEIQPEGNLREKELENSTAGMNSFKIPRLEKRVLMRHCQSCSLLSLLITLFFYDPAMNIGMRYRLYLKQMS